jgi:hypothetical protein
MITAAAAQIDAVYAVCVGLGWFALPGALGMSPRFFGGPLADILPNCNLPTPVGGLVPALYATYQTCV